MRRRIKRSDLLPPPRWAAGALLVGLFLGSAFRSAHRADDAGRPSRAGEADILAAPSRQPSRTAPAPEAGPGVRPVRVTVVGPSRDDPRWLATREAVEFWNRELARMRARIRFVGPRFVAREVPPSVFRHRRAGRSSGRSRLAMQRFAAGAADDADVLVLLADTAVTSFASKIRAGALGGGGRVVVGLQDHRTPPLSYPYVARNLVAHELGHVLGLKHGSDPLTLMCGRPARCRPEDYRSLTPHFLALTEGDRARLVRGWSRMGRE